MLIKELPQTGETGCIPHEHDAVQVGTFIHTGVVREGTIDFFFEIVKYTTHGLENRFGILGLSCVAFEVFGFGVGEFQFTRKFFGEVVATNGNVS